MVAPRPQTAIEAAKQEAAGTADVNMRPHYAWMKFLSVWLATTLTGLGLLAAAQVGWINFLWDREDSKTQMTFVPSYLEATLSVDGDNVKVIFPSVVVNNVDEVRGARVKIESSWTVKQADGVTRSMKDYIPYFDITLPDPDGDGAIDFGDPDTEFFIPIAKFPGGALDTTKQYIVRLELAGPRTSDGKIVKGYISCRNWWRPPS